MEIAKWDEHVKIDYVRNKIIIPHIISRIRNLNATKILDIGCGSGYIDSKIEKKTICEFIDCIDKSENNIKFAISKYKVFSKNKLNFIHSDYSDFKPVKQYNLILMIYTLVEFKFNIDFANKINANLKSDGSVIIVLPDFLYDVLNENNNNILEKYINGIVNLKSKRITKSYKVPFVINRIEKVIEIMINSKFDLTYFRRKTYEISKAVFIMEFKKKSQFALV